MVEGWSHLPSPPGATLEGVVSDVLTGTPCDKFNWLCDICWGSFSLT